MEGLRKAKNVGNNRKAAAEELNSWQWLRVVDVAGGQAGTLPSNKKLYFFLLGRIRKIKQVGKEPNVRSIRPNSLLGKIHLIPLR